jgi:hypothetical protein
MFRAAALNVTEPGSCGLGGDLFCLFWNAKDKSLKGLNASGRSPKALTLQKARELGIKGKEMCVSGSYLIFVTPDLNVCCIASLSPLASPHSYVNLLYASLSSVLIDLRGTASPFLAQQPASWTPSKHSVAAS